MLALALAIWATARKRGDSCRRRARHGRGAEGRTRCCCVVYLLIRGRRRAVGPRRAPRGPRRDRRAGRPAGRSARLGAATSARRCRRAPSAPTTSRSWGRWPGSLTRTPTSRCARGSRRVVPRSRTRAGLGAVRALADATRARRLIRSSSASSLLVLLVAGPLTLGPLLRLGAAPVVAAPANQRGGSGSPRASGCSCSVRSLRRRVALATTAFRSRRRPWSDADWSDSAVDRSATSRRSSSARRGGVAARPAPVDDPRRPEWPDDAGGTAVGTARPVVAAGVHRRR